MKFFSSLFCGLSKPSVGPVDPNQKRRRPRSMMKRQSDHELDEGPYTPVALAESSLTTSSVCRTSKSQQQKQKQHIAQSNGDKKLIQAASSGASAAKISTMTMNSGVLRTICEQQVGKDGSKMQWQTRSSTLPLTNALGTIVTNATSVSGWGMG